MTAIHTQLAYCIYGHIQQHQSGRNDYDEFCELLKSNPEIDLNESSRWRDPLIINAANCGQLEYIKELVKNGANINILDREGDNALIKASSVIKWDNQAWRVKKSYHTIQYLLENGFDPNIRGSDGKTALMNVCNPSYHRYVRDPDTPAIVKMIASILIDYGANRELVDTDGFTAEQLARNDDSDDIADFIRDYPSVPDTKGCHECGI